MKLKELLIPILYMSVFWIVIWAIWNTTDNNKYYTMTNDHESECGFIHVGEAGDEYCSTLIPLEYFE